MNKENYLIGICDDEKYWQEQIIHLCNKVSDKHNIHFNYRIFDSGEDFLKNTEKIDILLLDEEMKAVSGQMIKEHLDLIHSDTMIIFITSHDEILYDSFGKNVYGFLKKPICHSAFDNLFDKLLKKLTLNQYIFLPDMAHGITKIPCKNILYIEANGSYSRIIKDNSEEIFVRKGLGELNSTIKYKYLMCIHKSYSINLLYPYKLSSDGLRITLGELCFPVARRRKKEVFDKFLDIANERAQSLWNI